MTNDIPCWRPPEDFDLGDDLDAVEEALRASPDGVPAAEPDEPLPDDDLEDLQALEEIAGELAPDTTKAPSTAIAPASHTVAAVFAGLEDDLAAAEDLRKGRLADNTRRVYADRWASFRTWAAERDLATEPTSVDVLAAFFGHLHRQGRKPATLQVYSAAIGHVHRQEGWADPTEAQAIRDLLEGARRADAGGRKKRRRQPVLACPADGTKGEGDLQRLIRLVPLNVGGYRDRTLLLIGWAGALRVSELVGLNVEDGQLVDGKLILTLTKSKTDQTGEGALVTLHPAADVVVCPVTAWKTWLAMAGIKDGPVFRRLQSGPGHPAVGITEDRLSERSVRDIIKRWAAIAGIDPARVSSHSLRRGFLTTAALKGVDPWKMQRHARHASIRTTEQYVELGKAIRGGAGEGLL